MDRLLGGLLYFVVYSIVICITVVNEKNIKKSKPNKFIHIFSATLIIVIPAILAGLRDISIGTDTKLYGVPLFESCVSAGSFSDVITKFPRMEWGYLIFSFIISRITSCSAFYLFSISVFIQLLVYVSLYRKRFNNSIVLGEIIYLFCFYQASLSMMRQMMAISIILLALTYLDEKKYIRSFLLMIVASYFHGSAIIGIAFFPIFYIFDTSKKRTKKKLSNKDRGKILLLLIVIIAVIVHFRFINIATNLINAGYVSEQYLYYLNGLSDFTTPFELYLIYPMIYIVFLFREEKNYKYISIAVFDLLFFYMQNISFYMYRIASYYMAYRILSISEVLIDINKFTRSFRINKKKAVEILYVIICIIVYWFFFYVKNNQYETIPYLISKV